MAGSSIKDIARMAGVSEATVSRVIHNNGYVATQTRIKVERVLKEHDYRVNAVARSLKKGQTKAIGLLITQIYPDPYQAALALHVQIRAREKGYRVILYNDLQLEEEEVRCFNQFLEDRVDGVIVTYLVNPNNTNVLLEHGVPVVLVERHRGAAGVDLVLIDDFKGGYRATEHLIQLGHRQIGFISARMDDEVEREIFDGYRKALADHGLPLDERFQYFGRLDLETGYNGVKEIMGRGPMPSAMFVQNDICALGALQALREHGLRVPDDCSLVGFDDSMAPFACPPLTSVAQPIAKIAQTAMDFILKRISGSTREPQRTVFEPTLVVRASTTRRVSTAAPGQRIVG